MKIIDLAEKQRNNEILPKHIRFENEDLYFDGVTYYDEEGNNDLFDILAMNNNALTHLYDEVEILDENELHANSVEFNINNDKRDCIITLDENDLGIDKLHLDNCSFNKENGKWYVKKYDFKTIKLEEEKKIPEKLVGEDKGIYIDYSKCNFAEKINEIIDYLDYLKSKGDK